MASVWIRTRPTKDGGKRYRVEYRLGGRESTDPLRRLVQDRARGDDPQALDRRRARRAARPRPRAARPPRRRASPLLTDACEAWRRSRIDVDRGHPHAAPRRARPRAQDRPSPRRRLDEITVDDVVALVAAARRRRLQARDDQEVARLPRDGARPLRDRPEPGPRQARQAAARTQGARPAAARRARRAGRRDGSRAGTCCRC